MEIQHLNENPKDIPEDKFKCETCEFMASTEAQLQDHMVKHEHICKFCELTFKTLETLGKHTCKLNIGYSEFKLDSHTYIFRSIRQTPIQRTVYFAL